MNVGMYNDNVILKRVINSTKTYKLKWDMSSSLNNILMYKSFLRLSKNKSLVITFYHNINNPKHDFITFILYNKDKGKEIKEIFPSNLFNIMSVYSRQRKLKVLYNYILRTI